MAANVVPIPSGDLLIVGAQVLQASQFIVEEKYLSQVSTTASSMISDTVESALSCSANAMKHAHSIGCQRFLRSGLKAFGGW